MDDATQKLVDEAQAEARERYTVRIPMGASSLGDVTYTQKVAEEPVTAFIEGAKWAAAQRPPVSRNEVVEAMLAARDDEGHPIDILDALDQDTLDAIADQVLGMHEGLSRCPRKPWCTKPEGHAGACYPFHDPDRPQVSIEEVTVENSPTLAAHAEAAKWGYKLSSTEAAYIAEAVLAASGLRETVVQEREANATLLLALHERPPVSPEAREELRWLCHTGGLNAEGEQDGDLLAEEILARFSVPSQPVYDEEAMERLRSALDNARRHDAFTVRQGGCPHPDYTRLEGAAAALVAALRGGELTREETP